ncbi:unnamed protein product, partial [Prorocentrum cordatum]
MAEYKAFTGYARRLGDDGQVVQERTAIVEVPVSLDESAQLEETQGAELESTPPSAFEKAGGTLEEMGVVASAWQLQPDKYNGKLIDSVDTFLLRIAETKTMVLTEPEFIQSVEDLYDEFKELNLHIKTFNQPRRSVKRHASDPPDCDDTAGCDTLPDTMPDTL